MKKVMAWLILLIFIFSIIAPLSALADEIPATETEAASDDVTLDCSGGIFMKGACSGPQTIPNIKSSSNNGDASSGPYAISPLMQPEAYNLIYNALKNYDTSHVYLTQYNIQATQLYQYFCSVLNDHPELFYVNTYIHYNSGSLINYVYFSYVYTPQQAQQMLTIYQNKINYILSSTVSPEMTTVEKILAIHDYIVLNSEYDYTNLENNTLPNEAGTAYGIIVQQIGVCQSYALAMSDLLNHLGIPCINIGSYAMNHVWNLININGNWYHLDATWDDGVFSGNPNRFDFRGYAQHSYFLLNDATISDTDHQHSGWDPSLYPASTDGTYLNHWAKNVRSGILWKNGNFYYSYAGILYEYNVRNNTNTIFYNTGNNNARNYIAIAGDWLYYTNGTLNNLCRIHLITKEVQTIDTFVGIDDLYIKNGELVYSDWETDNIRRKPISELDHYQTFSGYPVFTDSNGKYLSLSELTPGSTVNVLLSASKLTGGEQPSDILIQFYAGQKLVSLTKLNRTIVGMEGIYNSTITIPNEPFDRVSLYIWNLNQLKPLSIPVVMNQR